MHETTVTAAEKSVTATVVEAVAEETGQDPFELPPLYEVIDTDALNRLGDQLHADRDSNLTVTFPVAGCTVQVTGAGEVRVTDSDEAEGTGSDETRVKSERENLDTGSADAPAEVSTDMPAEASADKSADATTDAPSEATTDKSVAFESFDANESEAVESSVSNPAPPTK